ncbi:type II toxin-antitoxin system RelE/ParE family toxin [Erwinia rhapontici]|uniref:type II toxin-antitoxin system RelE/ParE family toxin n=1 Tax=Erwinia rhapontici TaxID=55212 RepID=UPI001D0DA920|nr:type II toxin-antitoxin system RelE/ParE family toxin [Erwinia rhapontici]UDQ80478.1 type II toxin-antitoxin system RelE/ParE family toxin [Erwinia rhapontici]
MTQGKRIKLTPKARDDLKDIFSYGVSHYGEVAADADIDRIFTALDMLKHHEIGQRRAEVGENMFSLVAAEHLLFFRPEYEDILVVRVLHHSRDVKRQQHWF